eukprot:2329800-Rhodomonas_salina.2
MSALIVQSLSVASSALRAATQRLASAQTSCCDELLGYLPTRGQTWSHFRILCWPRHSLQNERLE